MAFNLKQHHAVRNLRKHTSTPLSEKEKDALREDFLETYPNGLDDIEDSEDAIVLMTWGGKNSVLTFDENGTGSLASVNGAPIKEKTRALITYDDIYEDNKTTGLKITINQEKEGTPYLENFFEYLPYGIINKNRTGVGATTLEINSKRNSIIVMPTKNLAFNKVLYGPKTDSGKYACNYVGSIMEEVKYEMPFIAQYLQDDEIEYKKFIVVADSLYKVIESIGPSVYNGYFLMLDEIDSYQSDSTFRKSMANTLDYYFEFDDDKRCMVTATMQQFSNPKLEEEFVIDIEYTNSPKRDVILIHTDNPNAIAKEKIEHLYDTTQDKIVVAYNKVQYIMEVIENLGEKYKSDCAVLCSSMSRPYVKGYFGRLNNNKLPKRINFITCTYFTGIDIEEPFHLLSVANVGFHFTLLSPDRLTQIAGRARKGLISEHIIYNTREYGGSIKNPEKYRNYLLEYSHAVMDYVNVANTITRRFKDLADKSFLRVQNEIQNRSKIYYYKGIKIYVIRQNVLEEDYEIAYFNIDALYETNKVRVQLYSSPEQLCNSLSSTVNLVDDKCLQENRLLSKEQKQHNEAVAQNFKSIDEDSFTKLIHRLRLRYEELRLNDDLLKHIRREETRKNQLFIDKFSKLYKYVPFEKLITDLIDRGSHKTAFRGYCNAVVFWALAEDHVFKLDMKARFQLGVVYTKNEIRQKIDAVYMHHFDKEIVSEKHIQILGEYFITRKISSHKDDFIVESYDKLGFEFSPVITISPDQNLRELNLIEFSDAQPKKVTQPREGNNSEILQEVKVDVLKVEEEYYIPDNPDEGEEIASF